MIKKIIAIILSLAVILTNCLAVSASDGHKQQIGNYYKDSFGYFKVAGNKITYNNIKQTNFPSVISSSLGDFKNGKISFTFKAENTNEFGIRFRDIQTSYYFLNLDVQKGAVYLFRCIKNSKLELVKKANLNLVKNKSYKVEIKLEGTDFKICIDGKELIAFTDEYLPEGSFSFTAKKGKITISEVERVVDETGVYKEYTNKDEPVNIYIATDGDDEKGDGSYEKPFKTVKRAQFVAQLAKTKAKPINIIFKEGTYKIQEPIVIDDNDSGLSIAPVTYKGEDGKEVVFSGSTVISPEKFQLVKDEKIKARLYPEVKDSVYQVELTQFGITRQQIDWVQHNDGPQEIIMEKYFQNKSHLFINNRKQQLSRWPNSGFVRIKECEPGSTSYTDTKYGKITFDTTEPLRWKNAKDAFIVGALMYEYYIDTVPIASIDEKNMQIVLGRETQYGIGTATGRWSVWNLMEEIDVPGEYYIDHDTMMLYIYLPEGPKTDDLIELATYTQSFVQLGTANYVNIENLTFEKSSGQFRVSSDSVNIGAGIEINGQARNINILNCDFNYVGGKGVALTGNGYKEGNLVIDGCNFYNVAMEAVYIGGGDFATLTPFNGTVSNNMFYNSFINKMPEGSYPKIEFKHNLFADIPGCAMRGNDAYGAYSVIYNEFSNCTSQASDMGSFYTGRNAAGGYGTKVEYNLFHHYGRTDDRNYPSAAIYLDDGQGGGTYAHNIFYPKTQDKNNVAFFLSQGPDTRVYGNTIVNAGNGIRDGNRGFNSAAYNAAVKGALQFDNFIKMYPEAERILTMYESEDTYSSQAYISENLVTNNLTPYTRGSYDVKPYPTGTYDEPVVVDDLSIYVDPENLDFRVKKEANEKYKDIPDEVLTEDFNLDLIGMQRPLEMDESLVNIEMTAPLNNSTSLYFNRVTLGWQQSRYGSEYEYEVATDKEFKNVVETGKVFSMGVTLSNLKPSTDYYARVKAINYMKNDGYEVYNINGPVHFKTSDKEYVSTELLEEQIRIVNNDFVPTIVEGEEADLYVPGTKNTVVSAVKEAEKLLDGKASQDEIDAKANEIKIVLRDAKNNKVKGYKNLELNVDTEFVATNTGAQVKLEGNKAIIYSPAMCSVSVVRDHSNSSLLNFNFKIKDFSSGFFGFGLRGQNPKVMTYSDNCYYIVIKPDVIEVQKKGTIFYTFKNEYFENDKEYNVRFGTFTTPIGVNMYLEVDGKVVVDFIDKDLANAQLASGNFSVIVPAGATVELTQPAEKISGIFKLTENTENAIAVGGETFYDASLAVMNGNWTETGNINILGNKEFVSEEQGASIQFDASGKGIQLYKVYYWNNPSQENDTEVKVNVSGYMGKYETTLDLTKGDKGWTELGTFMFMSENGASRGDLTVTFTGSGKGKMSMSGMKIHAVDNDTNTDMLEG